MKAGNDSKTQNVKGERLPKLKYRMEGRTGKKVQTTRNTWKTKPKKTGKPTVT